MATLRLPRNEPAYDVTRMQPLGHALATSLVDKEDGTSVMLVWGYFLILASISVVVISGQFPWFTLAPATGLLMAAHIRYSHAIGRG